VPIPEPSHFGTIYILRIIDAVQQIDVRSIEITSVVLIVFTFRRTLLMPGVVSIQYF
jgi:hypothetical protein